MHHTVANWLFDVVMPDTKNGAAFKVVAAVARMTAGWQRQWSKEPMSFSDFERITGMARDSIAGGLEEALKKGYIKREKRGRSFVYSLGITVPNQSRNPTDNSPETQPINPEQSDNPTDEQSRNPTDNSPETQPITGDTSYKGKEKKEDNPFPFKPNPIQSAVKSAAEKRKEAIMEVCGLDNSIPAHVRDAENATAQLKNYTAEYIRERYGPGGWWSSGDFRGREGQQPTTKQVIETISKKTNPAVNGRNAQSIDELFRNIKLEVNDGI